MVFLLLRTRGEAVYMSYSATVALGLKMARFEALTAKMV
jgi:hypothetical protein